MYDQNDIQKKVLNLAKADERIRAVLLNGSRVNINVIPDNYQDFDLVFIVKEFHSFLSDRSWLHQLGKPLLMQLPDEMKLGKQDNDRNLSFSFLMIFEHSSRIDLTLFPYEKIEKHFETDSLTIVWLDKDHLFENIPEPSDKDYHIQKPNQQAFTEVCDEFWWCITNVAKGLKRAEIIYTKEMQETVVRPMFWQLIEWSVASNYNFHISLGKSGKFARKFISLSLYEDILKTYFSADIEDNWNALELMAVIFTKKQKDLADKLGMQMKMAEAKYATEYIRNVRNEKKAVI